MAKFGGFPGGGGGGLNINNLMKQAQKMQADMAKLQEELKNKEFSASSGGGAVNVTVNGKYELISIKINPEVLDDVEMVEDLICAAVNEAMRSAVSTSEAEMAKLSGGMSLPF